MQHGLSRIENGEGVEAGTSVARQTLVLVGGPVAHLDAELENDSLRLLPTISPSEPSRLRILEEVFNACEVVSATACTPDKD